MILWISTLLTLAGFVHPKGRCSMSGRPPLTSGTGCVRRFLAVDRGEGEFPLNTQMKRLTHISGCAAGAFALLLASGCSTKNYVKSQTGPLIQHTNELDDQT